MLRSDYGKQAGQYHPCRGECDRGDLRGRPSFFNPGKGPPLSCRGGKSHASMPGSYGASAETRGNGKNVPPLPRPKLEAVRAGSVQDDLPESCPSCGEEDGIVNACAAGMARQLGE